LKSVSAYANSIGGLLLFGVDTERRVVGLKDSNQYFSQPLQISVLYKKSFSLFARLPDREKRCKLSLGFSIMSISG